MIIKGSTRGGSAADALRLSHHLLADENETVDLIELSGVVASDLAGAIEEMRLIAAGSRSRRPLYHASINLAAEEARMLSADDWKEAVDDLERRFSLNGHPRAVVRHLKNGRLHTHVVWSRVDPVTLKAVPDSHSYRIHEQCARHLEQRWRLKPVTGVHTRPLGTPRPVARMTHRCHQAQQRTGVPAAAVSAALKACWRDTTDAQGFTEAIQKTGLTLVRGRRGLIVVDPAGTPHSLSRRLGITAAEVRRRLESLDTTSLPYADNVRADKPMTTSQRRTSTMRNQQRFGARRGRRKGTPPQVPMPLDPEYWRDLGYEVERQGPLLLVKLPGGTLLEDRGDQMSLVKTGEPTDAEIRLLVAAARARGWAAIRFFGSPAFQRRARLEALRQGYDLAAISLECEDNLPPPPAIGPMPKHIRRRLIPDPDTPLEAPPPVPGDPKAPSYRP